MGNKSPNPTDRHIGNRVRQRRMMLGMSQEKLGERVGVTFQQIQKNEKGANRIGASRLQQISHALGVPVSFFFEGAPQTFEAGAVDVARMLKPDYGSAFLATTDGVAIAEAFCKIGDAKLRRAIADLACAAAVSAPAQ